MKQIYDGKAKVLFEADNKNEIIIHYKDDATAFNGLKKEQVSKKGILNNRITEIIYKYLHNNNINTHFIKRIDERNQLCKKVDIILLEVIVRNYSAGSFAKRYQIEEGDKLKERTLELSYKKDELGDPLLNDYHAVALGIATWEQLKFIYQDISRINELLIKMWDAIDIKLIDFKAEYGVDIEGNIILADELSPDTSRLWDKTTDKKLDKDRFRRDLGDVAEAYEEILRRLEVKYGA